MENDPKLEKFRDELTGLIRDAAHRDPDVRRKIMEAKINGYVISAKELGRRVELVRVQPNLIAASAEPAQDETLGIELTQEDVGLINQTGARFLNQDPER